MINKIRDNLKNMLGKNLHFKYNGARNQIEEFDGYINQIYNYVFTIKINNSIIKSFTYTDILINNLEIIDKNHQIN